MTVYELASRLMAIAAVDPNIKVSVWDPIKIQFTEVTGVSQAVRGTDSFILIEVEGETER